MGLRLRAVEVEGPHRWRWVLTDQGSETPLADHSVVLDPAEPTTDAFGDLHRYLRWHADPGRRAEHEGELVARIGAWVGERVLGDHIGRLIVAAAPVTVRLEVPPEAEFLLFRPLELAHVDGVPLARRGDVSLIYEVGAAGRNKQAMADRLRMLAIFSLPTESTALALRRERYELTRLARRLGARLGRAVELEVVQYGATRERLTERMTFGGGPEVLHVSGHGRTGELLLERTDGSADRVSTDELLALLAPARARVRLAVVSACESAAGTVAETLGLLGLTEAAAQVERHLMAESDRAPETGIAHRIASELDCAVLAMRYPVSDEFAIRLAEKLYEGVFSLQLPLDRAVPRAVASAAGPEPSQSRPAISIATPTMFGTRAEGLFLIPPSTQPQLDPGVVKMPYFPPEPARFVGRVRAMATASAALAPGSDRTGVLFHGMAGAGKTACALELAYRHEHAFAALAFWQAPTRDDEFGAALNSLAISLEQQLGRYGFTMVDKIATMDSLRAFLPFLSRLLAETGLLLVLDNLETLLTPSGSWRDPRWAELITSLTGHYGESRVVLTSRVRPSGLTSQVSVEPVHALSRDETVLLARELPNLRRLLRTDHIPTRPAVAVETGADAEGGTDIASDRATVTEVLRLVQGHPKLLELADAAAADRQTLATHLAAVRATAEKQRTPLSVFFGQGESRQDADGFLDVLATWTATTMRTVPAGARLLFRTLCLIEDEDRRSEVVGGTWAGLWRRLDRPGDPPELAAALAPLTAAALVGLAGEEPSVRYRIHPGVAEAARAGASEQLRAAVDSELASWWTTVAAQADSDPVEDTGTIVQAGLAGAPYLVRQHSWDAAASMLERAVQRDRSLATVQAALPHLRRIADTTGTAKHLGRLAVALVDVDPGTAERLSREVIDRTVAAQDFRTASIAVGDLATLLAETGRLREALAVLAQKAEYTRRAGLGPWSQLADRGWGLRMRFLLGEYEQVLTTVETLRAEMRDLPEQTGADETAPPWNVREATLNAGTFAARALGRWQHSLDLNAELLASKQRRGAGPLELARPRLNDYEPLGRLGRFDEADALLRDCQQVFEEHEDTAALGTVLGCRAHLASARGHLVEAIGLEQAALRMKYLRPNPDEISISHYNLALHLSRTGTDPAGQVAHHLAAALVGRLPGIQHRVTESTQALADDLRAMEDRVRPPGSVADLAARVEQVDGVRFAELVHTLATAPESAEAALAEILRTARELAAEPESDPQPPEPAMTNPTGAAIAALDDQRAIQVLALVLDHAGAMPDAARAQQIDRRLREAAADPELDRHISDGQAAEGPPATAGELARTALAHLATAPPHADTVRRAISIAENDTSRFIEPATLAVGALVLIALQTELDLTRTTTGRWRLRIHKTAVSDSTLGKVLTTLIDLYRRR